MSKKLRILEVNKAYFPHTGGIETLIRQYSEELTKLDDVSLKALVCRDGRGKAIREKMNGVELLRAGSLGTYFSCPLSISFIKHFRRMAAKADVVHIHVPFPLADAALLLSGFKGKVVVSWHSDIVKQKKLMFFYKPFMRYLLKRADVILTATEGHVKHSLYLNKYSHKCKVLPYGITPEDYLAVPRRSILTEKATDKSCVKVFFTGRLVYYKGVDVLLKAFTKVKDCELFIAGTGELGDQLRNFVSSHNMEQKVHFLGFLPDEELRQAYADCDIFVLPSVAPSEAFGIVQLEAMVYGKPVINTALKSGVPYVSINGQTGLTVPPSSPKSLAQAINTLAEDRELREKYGRAAAERVKNEFNEKAIIGRLYDILKG
ncbi:glycosyltransferase [Ruminococcus flavefaciens]|uniref:Rhamnosyl/mannosyltransferase n=1 Tax=Ruminococcus flavefaciens TaxID=1265 RepID=A0A1M7GJ46_RUMFL|nr:glycosyltransferase [Ruminococcus flavefaciens]SHM16165.1 rhamnosyl/mannosyltransferase [Ruminococcus flavefaciens]